VTEIQTAYETERKERENEILKRDNKIKDLDLERKRGQTNLLLIVAILVAIVAVALLNSNRIKSRTNQALAQANQAVNAQKAALDEATAYWTHWPELTTSPACLTASQLPSHWPN